MKAWLPSEVRHAFAHALGDASVVLLQSAPRSIGYVVGGPDTIVDALLDALGPDRTVLVPTFTSGLTDPSGWTKPAVPEEQWDDIRRELPTFDPARSAPLGMGRLADLVWRHPDAHRSAHPVESVAAIGPLSRELTRSHPIDDPMGPRGPWARLVSLDARVLLLGVGLERCSLLHHCERMAEVPYQSFAGYAFPIDLEDERSWIDVEEAGGNCSRGFPKLLPHLEARSLVRRTHVGEAETLVVSARMLFDVATELLTRDAGALLCDDETCPLCPPSRALVGSTTRLASATPHAR